MSTPNDIIDMFADLHKSIYREVGTLMGRVLESRVAATPVVATTVAVKDSNLEERIMKAIDERFAALERTLATARLSGYKRKQPDTPSDSEHSDSEDSDGEAVPPRPETPTIEVVIAAPTPAPAPAPAPASEAVNEIVKGLAAAKITDVTPAVVKQQVVEAEEEAESEEEEAEDQQSDAADEEEEEAAELTPFKYKGKDYYMDADCNVYTVDEEGELIEDPVGIYDEKTRRITFNS